MKPYRDHSTRRAMLLIAFGVLLFLLVLNLAQVWEFLRRCYFVLSPLVLGLAIAFVLNVLMRSFETRVFAFMAKSNRPILRRLCRPVSLVATILSILIVVALILRVIVPGIEDTVNSLLTTLPSFAERCLKWITEKLVEYNISAELIAELQVDWNNFFGVVFDALKNGTGSVFAFAAGLTTSVFGGLINFFIGLILAIYILLQKEKIARFLDRALSAFLPDAVTEKIEEIARLSNQTFSNFITGQLLEAVILGVLCFIGMLIFRFPYAGVVSVLVAVSALIPIFGAWIGGGVSAFLILMVSPIKALLFLIFLLVLQQLENNLIYPRVVGKQVGLPAILVIAAVLIGGELGGFATILISVPLCSVLYTLFRQLIEYRLAKKKAGNTEHSESVPEQTTVLEDGAASSPTEVPAASPASVQANVSGATSAKRSRRKKK
ncbi:MAG: AI-2E family transporter [Clostridia bacterium]|nr:AI-2E family transporter [Clostridia bacterium]